jgi:hypothetical protein
MNTEHVDSIPWLLIVLRDPLALAWLDGDIGPGFTLEGELFEALGDSELSAFYDRLYDATGAFVGLQITPVPETEVSGATNGLPYARTINGDNHLRLFLTGVPVDNPSEVGDQAFGGRIYRSFSGELALSLDTYFLDDRERAMIGGLTARWVTVHPFGVEDGGAR